MEFIAIHKRTEDSFPIAFEAGGIGPIIIDTSDQFEDNLRLVRSIPLDPLDKLHFIMQLTESETVSGTPERFVLGVMCIELGVDVYEIYQKKGHNMNQFSNAIYDKIVSIGDHLDASFISEYFRKMDFKTCSYSEDDEMCYHDMYDNTVFQLKPHYSLCEGHYNCFDRLINLLSDYISQDVVKGVLVDYL